MRGLERLALAGADGDYLNDPAGDMPVRFDVLRRFLGAQCPSDVTAVAEFMIRCSERDLALAKQLAGDLLVQRPLIGLDGQQDVGPLLLELLKNGFWVWSASAQISTPLRSSSPRAS